MRNASEIPAARRRSLVRPGFTLIELLIVVAIIAILAAIAVPNFLEAQVRAKVSRVQSDLRSLSVGLESYRLDHNKYPDALDNPNYHDPVEAALLGPLDDGYYTQITRAPGNKVAGIDFDTVTTPIAYVDRFFTDPFVTAGGGKIVTYCYRTARNRGNRYILTSFGPDTDLFEVIDGRPGVGTRNTNPFSTYVDTALPSRLGDIDEHLVGDYFDYKIPGVNADTIPRVDAMGGLHAALNDLSYDPSNGTTSDGDIYRVGP